MAGWRRPLDPGSPPRSAGASPSRPGCSPVWRSASRWAWSGPVPGRTRLSSA